MIVVIRVADRFQEVFKAPHAAYVFKRASALTFRQIG
jgi:hypothetical protein